MRNFQHQILYIKQKFSDKLNFFDRLFLGGGVITPPTTLHDVNDYDNHTSLRYKSGWKVDQRSIYSNREYSPEKQVRY